MPRGGGNVEKALDARPQSQPTQDADNTEFHEFPPISHGKAYHDTTIVGRGRERGKVVPIFDRLDRPNQSSCATAGYLISDTE
jgi:hypothetical protein